MKTVRSKVPFAKHRIAPAPVCYKIQPRRVGVFPRHHCLEIPAIPVQSQSETSYLSSEMQPDSEQSPASHNTSSESSTDSERRSLSNVSQPESEAYYFSDVSQPHPEPEPLSCVSQPNSEPSCISDSEDPECMICLSRPPSFVVEKCGHQGLCNKCRRYVCKQQSNENNKFTTSASELKMKDVERVAISCPCCRTDSKLVHHSNFTGRAFPV